MMMMMELEIFRLIGVVQSVHMVPSPVTVKVANEGLSLAQRHSAPELGMASTNSDTEIILAIVMMADVAIMHCQNSPLERSTQMQSPEDHADKDHLLAPVFCITITPAVTFLRLLPAKYCSTKEISCRKLIPASIY
jgi:hypothetical protein